MNKKLFAGALCATVLAASALPALAAETMPLAPNPSAGLIAPSPASYTVESDGALVDLRGLAPYEKAGRVMIPVRAVAESLGFTVTWEQETQSVKIDNGAIHTRIFLGQDSYSRTSSTAIGMGAPQSFGVAPEAPTGSTFVPAELFTVLDYAVTAENGVVNINTPDSGKVEIPNPMKSFDALEDALATLPFAAKTPAVPDGYTLVRVDTIMGTTLQVRYGKGEDSVTFRTAQSTEDISGNFNTYANTAQRTVGGLTVTVKGDGDTVSQANWNDGDIAYSLTFSAPVEAAVVDAIVESVA